MPCRVASEERDLQYSGGWSPSRAGCLCRLLGLAFTSSEKDKEKEERGSVRRNDRNVDMEGGRRNTLL